MTNLSGAVYPDQVLLTPAQNIRPLVRQGFASRLLAEIGGGPLPRMDSLLATASSVHLATGDPLCEPGKPFPYLVLVERGLLAQAVVHESRDTTVAFLERGDVTGNLFALYGDTMRESGSGVNGFEASAFPVYRVSAVSEARVILLDPRVIATLAARHGEWATLRSHLLLGHTLRQSQREVERLTRSSDERYDALVERSPDAASQLTQREIARYLGISEVTMSRLMARRGGRRGNSPRKPAAEVRD
jgi:CRP-like cAMP-binding protein